MNEYSNINLLHCLATPIVKIKIVVTSEGSVERNKKTKRVRNSQNGQLVITSQSKKFPLIVQMSSMGPNNTHQFASQCLTIIKEYFIAGHKGKIVHISHPIFLKMYHYMFHFMSSLVTYRG